MCGVYCSILVSWWSSVVGRCLICFQVCMPVTVCALRFSFKIDSPEAYRREIAIHFCKWWSIQSWSCPPTTYPESQSEVNQLPMHLRQEHVNCLSPWLLVCWYMQAIDIKIRHQITRNIGWTLATNPVRDFASSLNAHVTQGGPC